MFRLQSASQKSEKTVQSSNKDVKKTNEYESDLLFKIDDSDDVKKTNEYECDSLFKIDDSDDNSDNFIISSVLDEYKENTGKLDENDYSKIIKDKIYAYIKDQKSRSEDKTAELDKNGDGRITKDEIYAYIEAQKSSNEDKTEELDKNGDGKITQAEIDAYNAEHTSSSEADAVKDDTVKNERIAKLDKAEAEVYSKYQDMLDKLEDGENVRDAIFKFMDGLSDDELTSFLNAYNFVNSEEGGKTELCCDLFAELLKDDGTDIEFKTFERLSNILSDEDKNLIFESLNKKMEASISRMTYHTKDGRDSGIPSKDNQEMFRRIYAQQMNAFIKLLNEGDSSEMKEYIEHKNNSTYGYDASYDEGNGMIAILGGLVSGKSLPDNNWDSDIPFQGLIPITNIIADMLE